MLNNNQLDRITREAYQEAYGYDSTANVPEGIKKFMELYNEKKIILEFEQTPMQFVPRDPSVRKAKEIALEAAVQYCRSVIHTPHQVTESAEVFYRWLTNEKAEIKEKTQI